MLMVSALTSYEVVSDAVLDDRIAALIGPPEDTLLIYLVDKLICIFFR